MSTRRSARIRNIDLGVATKPAESAPAPTAPPKRKRKAPAEDEQDESTAKGKKAPVKKVKATTSAGRKPKSKANYTAEIETQEETLPVPDDVLSVLPAEILQQILESVNDSKSMVKMACTSKRYYAVVMAIIHKRISVSTYFWAHIPHVIRRIEPHLSIAQKKQLKREGQYNTGLETLRFHYRHSGSEPWHIPYASAENVKILTKNLPSLRVFEVAPQEDDLDSMARALSRAKNLTNLLCPNFKSYYEDRENAHLNLAKKLLGGFLENASSCEKFVWEENYKLGRITMGWTDLRIGSGLKLKKNFEKPVKIEKADRAVMAQDLRPKKCGDSKQVYYTAHSRWVDHVTRPDRGEGPLQLVYDD